jgi:transposase
MRDTYLRSISTKERNMLHILMEEKDTSPNGSGYRAKIILLKDEGYTVPEIRKITNRHDNNIRKWIHRFNENGIDGIVSKIHKHKPIKITDDIEKKIVEVVAKNPRKDYELPFSTWSLRILAGFITKEVNLVDNISHTEVRNILLKHGITWRQSKVTLGVSLDPEYNLKKRESNN